MLERGEPATVLDVRPEDQSTDWWIPGSVHFYAYRALKANDPDAMKAVELAEGAVVSYPFSAFGDGGALEIGAARLEAKRIAGSAPPPPEDHDRIAELNRAGELPEGDATELEAGANRCAVA